MKYTETHEWIAIDQERGIVGISNHAQKEIGEIVFVPLPSVGQKIEAGEEVAVLESTKAAADIYSPVSGEVVEINPNVVEDPSLLNSSPEKEGWLFKIAFSRLSELDTLLDHLQYFQLCES